MMKVFVPVIGKIALVEINITEKQVSNVCYKFNFRFKLYIYMAVKYLRECKEGIWI